MKIIFIIAALSIVVNCFLLYMVAKYRNIVVIRNRGYQDLRPFPTYKNDNYSFELLRNDPSRFNNLTVFIGSSIVQRWNFKKYFQAQPFINRGIGNDTSEGMRKRFEKDVVDLKPKKTVIFTCANDVKCQISSVRSKENLAYMLSRCLEENITPIVFILMPVLYSVNPSLRYSRPESEIKTMENALISLCHQMNVTYIYVREHLEKEKMLKSLYGKDGIHLNENGYALLSHIVIEKIRYPKQ